MEEEMEIEEKELKRLPLKTILANEVAMPFWFIKRVMGRHPSKDAQDAIEDLVGIVVYNILKDLE